MDALLKIIKERNIRHWGSNLEEIESLEKRIGFILADDYRKFLIQPGAFSYLSLEVFGLGVPSDYYLNVENAYLDIATDPSYPRNCMPLIALGDGTYSIYNNINGDILIWTSPNGGIVERANETLENFFINKINVEAKEN